MGESTRGFSIENGVLKLVMMPGPDITVPDGVRSIGGSAFANHHKLRSVTLPDGVRSIESNAFYHCENLTEVRLPAGLRQIGSFAFYGCAALTRIDLPEGLKTVGCSAFAGCPNLKTVSFPGSLETVESDAFNGCAALAGVDLPEGLKKIGAKAFWKCSGLQTLTVPESLTVLGEKAFAGCSGLKELHLPESLTQIAKYGFDCCRGLYDKNGMLIVNRRLCGYNKREADYVSVPDDVIYIEPGIFGLLAHLEMSLRCPDRSAARQERGIEIKKPLLLSDGSTVSFRDENGTVVATVILAIADESPETQTAVRYAIRRGSDGFDFAGYDRCFAKLRKKGNKFRMAVTRLEQPYALSEKAEKVYTSYLENNISEVAVQLIRGNELKRLIWLCERMEPSAEALRELIDTSYTCNHAELTAWLLQYQYERSGGAYVDDLSLELTPPDGAQDPDAPENAQQPWSLRRGCNGLADRYRGAETEITFPAVIGRVQVRGIADMDDTVPENYKKLRSVVIPAGYEHIGARAFAGCEALEHVEVPATLNKVCSRAFADCRSLKQLFFRNSVTFSGSGIFSGAGIGTLILETSDSRKIPDDLFAGSRIDRLVVYGGRFLSLRYAFGYGYAYPTVIYCSERFDTMDPQNPGFRQNCKILPLTDFDETTLGSPMLRAILTIEKRRVGK